MVGQIATLEEGTKVFLVLSEEEPIHFAAGALRSGEADDVGLLLKATDAETLKPWRRITDWEAFTGTLGAKVLLLGYHLLPSRPSDSGVLVKTREGSITLLRVTRHGDEWERVVRIARNRGLPKERHWIVCELSWPLFLTLYMADAMPCDSAAKHRLDDIVDCLGEACSLMYTASRMGIFWELLVSED